MRYLVYGVGCTTDTDTRTGNKTAVANCEDKKGLGYMMAMETIILQCTKGSGSATNLVMFFITMLRLTGTHTFVTASISRMPANT